MNNGHTAGKDDVKLNIYEDSLPQTRVQCTRISHPTAVLSNRIRENHQRKNNITVVNCMCNFLSKLAWEIYEKKIHCYFRCAGQSLGLNWSIPPLLHWAGLNTIANKSNINNKNNIFIILDRHYHPHQHHQHHLQQYQKQKQPFLR